METNKENIAVKLTKKNCKKVLGILEMFGEDVYFGDRTRWSDGIVFHNDTHAILTESQGWKGFDRNQILEYYADRKEVKPRELRNILAKEHLKEGDIFIGRNDELEFVGIFDNIRDGQFKVANWRAIIEDGFLNNDLNYPGFFDNFLRYATDEEKALLEPKSEFGVDELEVGVWYVSEKGSILNYQRGNSCFGWFRGDWTDCCWSWADTHDVRKATDAEVIEALKKECVKRYGEDWENAKINANADARCKSSVNDGNGSLLINTITVWNKNGNLFYKGKWAEPLPATEPVHPTRTIRKIEIAEFIGIPVEQLEIID